MNAKKSNNNPLMILAVVILIGGLVGGIVYLTKKPTNTKTPSTTEKEEVTIVPTINASTRVELAAQSGKKEIKLSIMGIPEKTESIEYELSYEEETKGLQGVVGVMTTEPGKKEYTKEITLGTCSSGRCVYHNVIGSIKVTLKFAGGYGERLFEKEYDI